MLYGLSMYPVAYGGTKALSSMLSTTYRIGRAMDDWNYWNDYYRNTGYLARYKYRSGSYDYLKVF